MVSIDRWWNDVTRDRIESLLELVLSAVADDYESLDTILAAINREYPADPDCGGWAALKALPISRFEVVKALRELTQEGYAQAYLYDARENEFRAVDFRQDQIRDLWIYATPKGIRAVRQLRERDAGKS